MSRSANSKQSVNRLREDAVCFFFDVKSIKDQLKRLVNTRMMNNASERERERDEKDTLLIITERREKKNVSRQSKSSKSLIRRANEINYLLDESLSKIHAISRAIEEKNCCCRFEILLRHFSKRRNTWFMA